MKKEYQKQIQDLVDNFGTWFNDKKRVEDGKMTNRLYPYEKLFAPIQINSVKVKNRIVMGPMGNICMSDEGGRPSSKMMEYFAERAKGGTGLITSGLVPVNWNTDPAIEDSDNTGMFPRIDHHRSTYVGWKNIADACHAFGAKYFIQLTPGVGRVGSPECLLKKHKLNVSASWTKNHWLTAAPVRPLWGWECRSLIKSTGQAATDAKELGIDGVYLHGHEGYLLDQMTNPAFNRRKTGRFSDWQCFGLDLVREIRRRCGDTYPVMYRIDLSLALGESYGDRVKKEKTLNYIRDGRTVEMSLEYMRNLVSSGVDIVDVDLGCYENWWLPHPPSPMPPGCFLPVSRIVKTYFAENNVKSNAGLDVPVVAVGKLGFPDLAEKALREDMCDMIMLARPLLADPHWPLKAYAGKVRSIIPCIGDQEGCLNRIVHGGHLECAVNPRTGFEELYKGPQKSVKSPKKVAVVGAGPAGVYCACAAAQCGHKVTLYDAGKKAGGCLIPGAVPEIKFETANFISSLNEMVKVNATSKGLRTRFNIHATVGMLKRSRFDCIVVATGAKSVQPPVPGINLHHVIQAEEILNNPAKVKKAQKAVIIGGGDVGCEVAYFLAYEKGIADITIVEMNPHFMPYTCTANRGFLIHYLEAAGVKLINCSTLKRINEKTVEVLRSGSKNIPDPYNTWTPVIPENVPNPFAKKIKGKKETILLEADLVILATGMKEDGDLYYDCVRERAAVEIYNIGDSFSAKNVLHATRAGFRLGNAI